MSIPNPWTAVLLALAAWRLWTLLSSDTILDPVRDRVFFKRGPSGRRIKRNDKALTWLECPYCSGWWTGIGWLAAWQLWPEPTTIAAAFFAIGTAVVVAEAAVGWLTGE